MLRKFVIERDIPDVGLLTQPQLQGAAYGRRLYLVTGGANTYTSRDAVNWTPQPATATLGVQGAAFFNNQFVAVGNSGAIATTFEIPLGTLP